MFTSKLGHVTIHSVCALGSIPITEGEGWMYIDRRFRVRPCDPARQCCPNLEIAEQFVNHLFPERLRKSINSKGWGFCEFDGKVYPDLVAMYRENDPVIEKTILNIESKILKLCNKLILAGCVTVIVDYRQPVCLIGEGCKDDDWRGIQLAYINAAFYGSLEETELQGF